MMWTLSVFVVEVFILCYFFLNQGGGIRSGVLSFLYFVNPSGFSFEVEECSNADSALGVPGAAHVLVA